MANFNSFLFDGHGTSEVDGSYDPGAVAQGQAEHDIVTTINGFAREFLNKTSLAIHYDEQNYIDIDLKGNTYSTGAGASIHINAGGGTGPEIYVPLKEDHLVFEQELAVELASIMGTPNRGVKSREFNSGATSVRSHGHAMSGTDYYKEIRESVQLGLSLAIVEIGFIDTSDLQKINANARRIGHAIAKYICKMCGVTAPAYDGSTTTPPVKPPTTNETYTVRINNAAIYVLNGPGSSYDIVTTIYKDEVYTIVETKNGYGKLKSGAGWINLSYTTRLSGTTPPVQPSSYTVRIVNAAIYVLNGPSPDYDVVQTIYKDEVYTIVETKNGYGKLKSGAGWINLSYTTRV